MGKSFPVKVAEGARLVTTLSTDNVGEKNWVQKTNMRRVRRDQEGRQEGWVVFDPYPDGPADQYTFDGTESVLRLAELVRPNGDRVIVGASRTKLKKFDTATMAWSSINGALTFSAIGKRWQAVSINGYLVLNNTVDLLVSYRVEDSTVTPIYELRQMGVARVGRIANMGGFLEILDITEIKAVQLDTWMNGYSNYTVSATQTKSANFSVVIGDHRNQFDVTTGASTITVTLPALTFSQRMYCWIKKVDGGAGTVVTSPAIVDEALVLDTINDIALVWWNGQNWAARNFPSGTIPAHDAYGTPPAAITNRLPYAVANSEFGEPTKWAPAFKAVMAAAGTSVVLPFVPSTWVARTTRVAVQNGGPDGDVLGGQTGYEDGVLVTAIGAFSAASMGVAITLEVTTDTGLTYPRVVTVLRWTDISTIVGRYLLQDDGSEIIGAVMLGDFLMVARTTGWYVGRYTGDVTPDANGVVRPFVWTPKYPAANEELNVPLWGDCIANIRGEYLLYPGVGNRFYRFDGVSWPTVHPVCDDASSVFFNGVETTDECFCVGNPFTKQMWFCSPDRVLAYDTEFDSASEIDAAIGAAAIVRRPGTSDTWFILAIAREVLTYGLTPNAATPVSTFLRKGVAPTAVLKSGLVAAKDTANEKMLVSYCPVLASQSPDVEFTVQLNSTHNPSATPVALLDPVETLPTPAGECFFTCAFQNIYFQDVITLTDTDDVDFRVSERLFEFEKVGTGGGVPRRVT